MKALEADGIEKGFSIVAAKKPAVASKLWKSIESSHSIPKRNAVQRRKCVDRDLASTAAKYP